MADTTIVLQDVRQAIWEECGKPSEADLPNIPDGIIDRKIDYATRKVLRGIAASGATGAEEQLDSITCVDGQQSYAIPDNREIDEIFWSPASSSANYSVPGPFSQEFANIPDSGVGVDAAYWRSDELIDEMKRAQLDNAHYYAELLDGLIWVYPAPTSATQKIWYTYHLSTAEVTTLSIDYERAVVLFATAECLRYLANRYRGRSVPSRDEGFARAEKSAELEAAAEKYEERFNREMGEIAGI